MILLGVLVPLWFMIHASGKSRLVLTSIYFRLCRVRYVPLDKLPIDKEQLSMISEETIVIPSSLLNMPIKKAIFHLAWPAMFSGLLENLATTVDMIMVGKLGAAAIASVGFCAMINWALASLVMGMSVAVTAIVARNFGGGLRQDAEFDLAQVILLSFALAVVMAFIIFALAPWIMNLFGVEKDVYVLSVPYLRIIAFSGIFYAMIATCSGALRGAGDTRTPLFVGFVTNLIHVGLNYILIFGKLGFPTLGVRGAAFGSMLSLIAGTGIYLYLFRSGLLKLSLSIHHFKWDSQRVWYIIRLAIPASIEQFILQVGLLAYAKFIVVFGTAALSGYQVGMQVLSLSFIPNGAFSAAATTLVGQNLGADRKAMAKRAGWICLGLGTLSMSVIGAIAMINAKLLASIFVKEPEVIRLGVAFIWIVAFSQPAMAIFFTLSGALRGAGDTRSPMLATLIGMYGIRIPVSWILSEILNMGIEAIFSLLIFDYIARIVAILFFYHRGKWMEKEV